MDKNRGALGGADEILAEGDHRGHRERRSLARRERLCVVREEFPVRNIGVIQAFAFNIRHRKFLAVEVDRRLSF